MAKREDWHPFQDEEQLMSTEPFDKRSTPRAQYFLIQQDNNLVPVYAFRPEHDNSAVAALVIDLSDGGMQVLTTVDTPLNSERYDLELINGEQSAPKCIHRTEVRRIWSRKDGIHTKSGFAFADATSPVANLVESLANSEHRLLRCVLHPLD